MASEERTENEYGRILWAVFEDGETTRAGLSEKLELGRRTVSRLVERLLDIGALREVVKPFGPHRRPTGLLSLNDDKPFCILDLSGLDFTCLLLDGRGRIMQKTHYFCADSLDFEHNLHLLCNRIKQEQKTVSLPETALILPFGGARIKPRLMPERPTGAEIEARIKALLAPASLLTLAPGDLLPCPAEECAPCLYIFAGDTLTAFVGDGQRFHPVCTENLPIPTQSFGNYAATLGGLIESGLTDSYAIGQVVIETVDSALRRAYSLFPDLRVMLDTCDAELAGAAKAAFPDVILPDNELPFYVRGAVRRLMEQRIRFFSGKAAKPIDFHGRL